MAEHHESPPLEEKDETKVEINTDSASVDPASVDPANVDPASIEASNSDPLLSQDVKEREHNFNPTIKTETPEDEGDLDELFGGADDELTLEPPKLDTQEDDTTEKPDLDSMKVDQTGANVNASDIPPTGISSSVSELGWEIVQNHLPNMVHELTRMEKRDVDEILSKVNARCGEEEIEVIEEINTEFKNGLQLSPSHNQMGKEAMRQLFVSKGIEKKMTPELMLVIVVVLILISWGLAYKRFRRQKRDLFDRLEHLVKLQLKAQKETEKKNDQAPPKED